MKTALVTIARMNPPTLGHLQLIKKMLLYATFVKEKDVFIILSSTVDKKNPLSCNRKKELLDTKRWEITEKQSATQPSFIRNDLINGEITNDVWWEN